MLPTCRSLRSRDRHTVRLVGLQARRNAAFYSLNARAAGFSNDFRSMANRKTLGPAETPLAMLYAFRDQDMGHGKGDVQKGRNVLEFAAADAVHFKRDARALR